MAKEDGLDDRKPAARRSIAEQGDYDCRHPLPTAKKVQAGAKIEQSIELLAPAGANRETVRSSIHHAIYIMNCRTEQRS